MEGYTACEMAEAKAAREAQGMIGYPTNHDFLGMPCANMIINCHVTESAIQNANRIFGPNLVGVRGRTVRWATEVVITDYVSIH